jgi:hypothetical protein
MGVQSPGAPPGPRANRRLVHVRSGCAVLGCHYSQTHVRKFVPADPNRAVCQSEQKGSVIRGPDSVGWARTGRHMAEPGDRRRPRILGILDDNLLVLFVSILGKMLQITGINLLVSSGQTQALVTLPSIPAYCSRRACLHQAF